MANFFSRTKLNSQFLKKKNYLYNIFFFTANAVITCPICRAPGNRWSVQAYQVLALLPTWDIYKTTLAPGAEAPKKTVAEIIWQDEENE